MDEKSLTQSKTSLANLARAKVSIGDGIGAFFGGFGFLMSTPSAWGWALVPMFIAFTLLLFTGWLGVWGATALYHHIHAGMTSAMGSVLAAILFALLIVVAILLAFAVACALAQPLSGFALEALARKQEAHLGRPRVDRRERFGASFLRSLRVTLTGLLFGLPLLAILALITFLFPPASVVTVPLKFFVVSMMIAWDFLDYPLGVRGADVRERLEFIGHNFGSVAVFGMLAGLVLLVPGVGLVVLPAGVCGATRLLVKSETRRMLP